MCAWEGAADFYRDTYRHGGIKCDWYEGWYRRQVVTVQHGVGERGAVDPNSGMLVAGPETLTVEELARNREEIGDPILAHPLDDQYYRDRSPDWSKLTVPLLSTANWGGQGLHARGNFEGFVRAASKQKWLEVHGIEHWTHFYTDYGRNLQKRFMDYFLKGVDNGWSKQPPVQLQVRHVDKFVQRYENEWPLARTRWTKLCLEPARRMLQWGPVAGESKVEYKALSDGVTFLSAPFKGETEITGPVALKLFLSASTIDADVFATLRLFDPKGNEVTFAAAVEPRGPIAQGWLRASHRKLDPKLTTEYRPYHTHDEVQLLLPGKLYELAVEIWPTCIVVPADYRIALTLQGKDFERPGDTGSLGTVERPMRGSGPFTHTSPVDRPAEIFDNMHTIFGGGAKGSYLLLPIIPSKA
jgi:predicted acyl esterase